MPDDTDNRQGGCTRAMLVAGVVPLVVALAVGAALRFQSIASTESAMARTIERSWEREAEVYLLEFARRLAFETHRVMAERIDNAREWASTPTIRNAARTERPSTKHSRGSGSRSGSSSRSSRPGRALDVTRKRSRC